MYLANVRSREHFSYKVLLSKKYFFIY